MLPRSSDEGIVSKPTDQSPNYRLFLSLEEKDSVNAVKFSHCGEYLASASTDKLVRIWRIADAKCVQRLIGHKDHVNDVSWSSDDKHVVSASHDYLLKIFEVSTATCSKTLKGHYSHVISCSFNPQDTLVASGSFDYSVRIWDVKTGRCVRTLNGHSNIVQSVSFNRCGDHLCSGSCDGFVKIWDVSNGDCVKALRDDDGREVNNAKFSPDEKYVLVSYARGIIKLWDISKEKCRRAYIGHLSGECFNPANFLLTGGQYIVCGSDDLKIYIWGLSSMQIVQTLEGHTTFILTTDCHPNRCMFASAGAGTDCAIRLWKSDFPQEENSNQDKPIEQNVEPPIVPGTPTAQCPNYQLVRELGGHTDSVFAVKFSLCGKYLASASADKTARIWHIADGKCVQQLIGHNAEVNDVSWSWDGKYVVTASDDHLLKIFEISTATCMRTLEGHDYSVLCCDFNPQGSLVASGSFDDSVRIWDVETGNCVRTLNGHSCSVCSVSFKGCGVLLCSGSFDGFIKIWDVSNGQCLKSYSDNPSVESLKTSRDNDSPPVSYVKYSPNGKYVLVSYAGGIIKLWDLSKGKCSKVYTGHQSTNYCTPANYSLTGGNFIVSGSEDFKVYIWRVSSKQIVQILEGHTTAVLTTDCHRTQNLIASGGIEPDCVIRLWKSDFQRPRQA